MKIGLPELASIKQGGKNTANCSHNVLGRLIPSRSSLGSEGGLNTSRHRTDSVHDPFLRNRSVCGYNSLLTSSAGSRIALLGLDNPLDLTNDILSAIETW
jgi:hypothetical protein